MECSKVPPTGIPPSGMTVDTLCTRVQRLILNETQLSRHTFCMCRVDCGVKYKLTFPRVSSPCAAELLLYSFKYREDQNKDVMDWQKIPEINLN